MDRRTFLGQSAAALAATVLPPAHATDAKNPMPASARPVELVGSYWTFAGGALPHSDHEFSTFDFRERVEALSKAGFRGMGIWHADLARVLEKYSLADMKRIFADHGIVHVELEFLTDWFLDGDKKKASDERKQLLLSAAEALEARHVKVGDFDNSKYDMPRLIESWAALCKDGAQHGTRILFELMPFSMLTKLTDTLSMLDGAGAPNGGIMFDFWHIEKLRITHDELARVPPKYMLGVEMNDGFRRPPPEWSLFEETINHRQFCGEGQFDVSGILAALRRAGYAGPYGIEVLSQDVRPWALSKVTATASTTTLAQFARA
ncbi:MAG TPA: sugar phosphate isomerase/epimerase [Steroidobacteraceae bacterium]|nr:sugar phosphate isomerase/epimerase [Steroidobacteraceae bacterium]